MSADMGLMACMPNTKGSPYRGALKNAANTNIVNPKPMPPSSNGREAKNLSWLAN